MEKGGSIVWVSQILDTYVKNLRASISDRPSPTDFNGVNCDLSKTIDACVAYI